MEANKGKTNFSEGYHKDHQRQQGRLQTMSATSDKVKTLSADVMIENLLKDTFKKPNEVSIPVEKGDHFYSELPFWLQCESSAVPSFYKQLWSLVALTTEIADTQKVSQLLLTSGLQVDVLGFIWNLANKVIPGQLTKQEFYIVLALVGLAQRGCVFDSLNVLKHTPVPSIPILQGSLFTNTVIQNCAPQNIDVSFFNSFQQTPVIPIQQLANQKNKRDDVNLQTKSLGVTTLCIEKQNNPYLNENVTSALASGRINCNSDISSKAIDTINQQELQINKGSSNNSNFPYIGSSPTSELEDDFSEFQFVPVKNEIVKSMTSSRSDDFTDFQSADVENLDPFQTVVVSQTREIPKILLPKSFSEKFTNLKSNIIKISPESEKRLKVLSTTESLSSLPESKISSTNKVSTSISVLGGSSVGNRLANHSFSGKPDKEKCYKHQKLKAVPGPSVNAEGEIIFGIKPMYIENLMPKCHSKNSNSKTFILKETKIKNDEILKSSLNDENGSILNFSAASKENTRQIEIPMLGTFNETVLPTQKKPTICFTDLISVQEDKYSALREIDLVLNQENNEKNDKNDEFGDFLSANISPPTSVKTDPPSISTSSLFLENDETKSWGDWSFSTESKAELNISTLKNSIVDESKPQNTMKKEAEDLFDTFTSLSLTETSECPKYMQVPKSAEEQNIFPAAEINLKSSNKNDILLFYDQNDKSNINSQTKSDQFNNQLETEFWDFLSTEVKLPAEVTLSRQGSLPSLDLKICAVEESEQEVIWRKCLESCHNLIQEGFDKFNGIRVKSVLDEVLSARKTGDYLNCLYIVYQISKRISQNFSDLPSIQEELERLWGRLQELCFEYNIKLTSSEEEISEGISQCSICLKYIVCDLINQGMHSYHPSCANLWINFIEKTLPFST